MNQDRWKKIEDIFQSALDRSGESREKFIRAECGDDAELRAEVEKLVGRYETEETFLESPVWTDSLLQPSLKRQIASSLENEMSPLQKTESFIGQQIGVYRLSRELGKGGMGIVYLGERADGEFSQKVAVKLIKRGMDTDFIVKRFRHERQILASLNHPNVARLLDGGTTDEGLPYFVMEYVEGKPFFKYSEASNLNLRQKLELFRQVCSAIAYAHERKIVHRDIKPGNILVTADGTPKLLDFGIAKILDPDLIHESVMPTATQMRLMTPEYASPEQVRGEEISPASDQYSLGVLLFELLTGARPYKFPSRAPHEIARVICEEMPSEPSSGEFGKLISGGDNSSFDDDFCKKLDRIVLKTLRKNPAERYASVTNFSDDIRRFLRNEPIRAESFASEIEKPKKKNFLLPKEINQKSIAVLPFKILNALAEQTTGDNGFLSVGLADALITRLSSVRQIIVRPTSSVIGYGANDADSLAAGRELNVGFVLDGNILRSNKRIRVSIQLLDVAKQSTVWAERFDEDLIDVLSLEDTISTRVAAALVPQLTIGERLNLAKRGTNDYEAYEAYLRGRYHWNTFSKNGVGRAIVFYRKALELDSNYALAHAGVADYYVWLGMFGVLPFNEFYPPAKQSALRAIELDGNLSEAYAALGLARLYGGYDWQASERDILRSLELNPNNSVAHLWYAHNLYTRGQFDEAEKHVRRAIELDPLSSQNQNTFAWGLHFANRRDEALAEADKLIEKYPNAAFAYFAKSCFLCFDGKGAEALATAEQGLKFANDSLYNVYGYAQALAAAGKREEAEKLLESSKSRTDKYYISNYHRAVIYSFLKDTEKVFEFLELSLAEHEGVAIWIRVEPAFDFLRDDARFVHIIKQLAANDSAPVRNAIERQTAVEKIVTDSKSFSSGETIFDAFIKSENDFESAKPTLDENSIAVLPFKILNAASENTTENAFLGVGLADSLITRLSNVRQFVVRPTSSVLRYGEDGADSFEAGEDLRVKYILDGNIIKTNSRIRVSVQLLNVVKHSVVWAERFDENSTDVLSLEDTISAHVVESLVPQLTSGERKNLAKRATDDPDAYEAYLRGRFYWNTFTEEGFAKAFVAYHEAIAHDPNYALAYAGIADYYMWLGIYGILSPKESYVPAQDSARRAIEIDAQLAEARAALGFAQLCGSFDWLESERNIRRAIDLNPNYAVAHNWLAIQLFTAGRFDEGLKHARRAIELDPLTYQNHRTLSWGFYFARRFDEALAQIDRTIKKFPGLGTAYFNRAWLLRTTGKTAEALQSSEKALETSNGSVFVLLGHAQSLGAAGRLAEAEKIIEEIKSESESRYVSYYQVALVYCYARETEKTLAALERAWADREGWLVWMAVEPAFDYLRDEPRFVEVLKKVQPPNVQSETLQDTSAQNVDILSESETMADAAQSKRKMPAFFKYALAALVSAIVVYGFYNIYSHTTFSYTSDSAPSGGNWRQSFASAMSVERLTTSGAGVLAAISPDGERIAFVSRDAERQGLWIRRTDDENAEQIVASDAVVYVGLIFSPDGKYVYYTIFNRTHTERILYRIATGGGSPEKLLDDVNSGVAFAPDGKRIAYFSFSSQTREMSLLVAGLNADDGAQPPETIAKRLQPDYFLANPVFTPDGEKIVSAVADVSGEKETVNLFVFDIASKTETKFGERDYNNIGSLAWRADKNEFVMVGSEKNTEPQQLWLVSYPSGETSRLTNDLTDYFGVSISQNSGALISTKKETISNVGLIQLNAAKAGTETNVKQLTGGIDRQDGIKGVSWAGDGQILYIAGAGNKDNITLVNADGTNGGSINTGDALPTNPLLSADRRYLFFIDENGRKSVLRRYEMATGALVQISSKLVLTPALSPDGKFIIYSTFNSTHKTSLHRIAIDGGEEIELTSASSLRPSVSPDGRFIACYYSGEQTDRKWEIAILNSTGGVPVRILKPNDQINLQSLLKRPLAWSPDGQRVYYINEKAGVSNIFRIAADGGNLTEQITNFTSGRIFDFAVSPDGRRVVVARGSTLSDVVIFKSSK